ncbi:hypothetical protein LCGC14_2103420 [marine sediment metagenome]|uniref:Uncharacterized protein n=1 Tax=marine sediment metagenome TaxID=412755 RepID=A0A0F9E9C9_9ZZZZ
MECSEDRGIECQGLCFNYVDGNVTLTVYKNLPGITRELAGTIFQRSFSINQWEEINGYLRETLDEANVYTPEARKVLAESRELRKEGMEKEEAEGLRKLEEMEVDKAFTPKVRDLPDAADTSNVELPKVNSIPSMTKDEEAEENGKE